MSLKQRMLGLPLGRSIGAIGLATLVAIRFLCETEHSPYMLTIACVLAPLAAASFHMASITKMPDDGSVYPVMSKPFFLTLGFGLAAVALTLAIFGIIAILS